MAVHTVKGHALTSDDRNRITEFTDHVHAAHHLPKPVRDGITALLRLVADGHDVSMIENDAILTPNEAARLVGVSRPLLNQILDDGRIPFFETAGGHRKIKAAAVRAYVEERDLIASQLAAARAGRTSHGDAIAAEFGLDPATAKRLGFT